MSTPEARDATMPTNVPPQYKEAEARYRAASTLGEKVAALEEMLRLVPKHKGTEKLQADLKARLSKLRRDPEHKAGARAAGHLVSHEGAGQIALVGPPNGGKSSLVDRLTHASPKIGDYPYTTREPVPGMMPYQDVSIQLVDLPPVGEEHVEPWVFDLVRRADMVWVVVEAAASLDGFERIRDLLEAKHIGLLPPGEAPPEDAPPVVLWKSTRAVLTGGDRPGAAADRDAFAELLGPRWIPLLVSSRDGTGLDDLAASTYRDLGVIRIYTKHPGKPPDTERPFTVPRGSTVRDLATVIHKELAEGFRFARVWGASVFDGQRVQGDHLLEEGDIVEIHI